MVGAALLMGLASSPHCAAMCGPSCAVAVGLGRRDARIGAASWSGRDLWPWLGLILGRCISYALAGAVVALAIAALAQASQWMAALRPFWTLLQLAWVLLGLSLLVQGRQPQWMMRAPSFWRKPQASPEATIQWHGPGRAMWRSGRWGLLWSMWPCGLLHSALLVAAFSGTPWHGASVMAAFALGSTAGLVAGPWIWSRWAKDTPGQASTAVRLAGLVLTLSGLWALYMGLSSTHSRADPFCFTSP